MLETSTITNVVLTRQIIKVGEAAVLRNLSVQQKTNRQRTEKRGGEKGALGNLSQATLSKHPFTSTLFQQTL